MSKGEPDKKEILAELSRLHLENAELKRENADLELMIQMHTEHSDHIEEDLLNKVESALRESEKRFRMITETIPVPMLISRLPGSGIVYANEPASDLLGLPTDMLLERKAIEFYDPKDRQSLASILSSQGYVQDYELEGKKADGKRFWVALFIQPLSYNDQPCLLTILYDITERRKAEEEIRKLKEKLEQRVKEREGKYLTFNLSDETYGISILKVKEIIGIMPITTVPHAPPYVKGVINLRGRVIPVVDLRARFRLPATDYTGRTCIIVAELNTEKKNNLLTGMIVDTVSEVLNIRGESIEDPPDFGVKLNTEYIFGMAKMENKVKILLDIDKILFDIAKLQTDLK